MELLWKSNYQKSFEAIKYALTTSPIIKGPAWEEPFHIHEDTSNLAIGPVLRQKDENGAMNAIYYVSKNLSQIEINYTTIEKEFLAMVYAINKFRHYNTSYKVFLHTNHVAIWYLMNKVVVGGRIIRWLLLWQEFDITIVDKPSKDNVVADFLYRIIF